MCRHMNVGHIIFELSKRLIFDFNYNLIWKKYKEKSTLLFADTNTLKYHISARDTFEDMKLHTSLFDFSD